MIFDLGTLDSGGRSLPFGLLVSESISSRKGTRTLWKHFRSCTNKGNSSQNSLPEELKVNGETYTDSEDIAFKLNEYFSSVCDQFQTGNDPSDTRNLSK